MKHSNFTLKLACYLIFAALLAWLALYTFQAMNDPYRTVPATSCSSRESVPVRGIVAREERVLTSVYDAVSLALADGQRVSAGGTVALAYPNQTALQDAVQLSELQAEAAELNALLAAANAENAQQTDAEIQSNIRSLLAALRDRSFSDVEALSLTLQTRVFAAFSSPNDILSRLKSCNEEIDRANGKGTRTATPIPAPVSGLFSASVDGWEELCYDDLRRIEPDALQALMQEERSLPANALGKLVSGTRWYFAALTDAEKADRLRSEAAVSVVFGRYYGEQLTMKLEWISAEENGVRTVLLSCGESMGKMLNSRIQEAELVLREESGLRVPRRALHVDEDGKTCVYVQTGLQAEKKLVTVLEDFDDYYMVTGEALRLGDQIIVSGKNLFAGKVVG